MLPNLTPSSAYGCIDLISFVSKNKVALSNLNDLRFGPVSTRLILDSALAVNWIEVCKYDLLELTERGTECLNVGPTISQLRMLLLDYALTCQSPWVQLARHGRKEVLLNAPASISQLFWEAELANGQDDDVVSFWDRLAFNVRQKQGERLTALGRIGEKLSMEFEYRRTNAEPKWMALESNKFGYDLLSKVSANDNRLLKIEVKYSERPTSQAEFYLTRHEWETAVNSDLYVFHLWSSYNNKVSIATFDIWELVQHLPRDCGSGEWLNTKIPFDIVAKNFKAVKNHSSK